MSDFRSLKFLDRFRGIFIKIGIDYDVMRKILEFKLTMDQRRVPTILSDSKKRDEGNQFIKSLGLYALYGLMLIPLIVFGKQYMFQMSIVFGITMFILMTSMVSDFSSVLLDVRDKNILNTKPVGKKTIHAAKLLHIIIYMFMLTGAFVAVPVGVGLFTQGMYFTLLFLANLLLISLFIVVLTAICYLAILRFFDGETLKDAINYIQIALSVGILVGYQLLARSFTFIDFQVSYAVEWWHALIPPFWFGSTFELVLNGNHTANVAGMSLLALAVPVMAIMIYYRLMPMFEHSLQKLQSEAGKSRKSTGLDGLWARLLCRKREERVFFRFSSLMMKREREFKFKVYPSLGFSIIFPFIFLLNEMWVRSFEEVGQGGMYYYIYFTNLMIPTVVHMVTFSGKYKGSWIYRAAPIKDLGMVYSAAYKAFLARLYLPVFVFVSILFIWIFSSRIIPDLLAVLLSGIAMVLITHKLLNAGHLPFSKPIDYIQEGKTAIITLLLLLSGFFVLVHFLVRTMEYGLYIYLALLIIAIPIAWRVMFSGKKQAIREAGTSWNAPVKN